MSWDVTFIKAVGRAPKLADDLTETVPLGRRDSVRESIAACLPGVRWDATGWGIYDDGSLSIDFNLEGGGGDGGPVEAFMAHVRGTGDAVAAILRVATPNGWSVMDNSTGELLDPGNPSSAGWDGFRAYRDHAVGGGGEADAE